MHQLGRFEAEQQSSGGPWGGGLARGAVSNTVAQVRQLAAMQQLCVHAESSDPALHVSRCRGECERLKKRKQRVKVAAVYPASVSTAAANIYDTSGFNQHGMKTAQMFPVSAPISSFEISAAGVETEIKKDFIHRVAAVNDAEIRIIIIHVVASFVTAIDRRRMR